MTAGRDWLSGPSSACFRPGTDRRINRIAQAPPPDLSRATSSIPRAPKLGASGANECQTHYAVCDLNCNHYCIFILKEAQAPGPPETAAASTPA
jgi:hypothetical protein